MDKTDKNIPNFIIDAPAKEDGFNTHKRVAKAVSDVLEQKSDARVIGLIGTWGSGKSTTVKFIKDEINTGKKGKDKTHFFTFDAWLHQSDPPRRSFIEELVQFLVNIDQKLEGKWDEDIAKLKRQVEERETTTTPTLTIEGRFILFSLFFIPLGTQLLSNTWFDKTLKLNQDSFFVQHSFTFGVALTLLPLIILGAFMLQKACYRLIGKSEASFVEEVDSLTSLLINKGTEKEWEKTTKDPEPTVIEFQKLFKKIIGEASEEGHKLVFVVDNLDRLSEKEALSFWGAVRGLFLGSKRKDHTKCPPVLLPIDIDSITRMFLNDLNEDDPHKAEMLAQSFIDKTFDLTFYIPQPIMSRWKDFMNEKLKEVFGNSFSEEHIEQTSTMFDHYLNEAHPTPRDINKLINFIATIRMQRDDIDYPSICYYCICHGKIKASLLSAIRTPQHGINIYTEHWQKNISAIHLGCSTDEAIQLTLGRKLQQVITGRNDKLFDDYSSNVTGFNDVCKKVIIDYINKDQPNDLNFILNASFLIGRGEKIKNTAWKKEPCWHLEQAIQRELYWGIINEKTAESLDSLLTFTTKNNIKTVIKKVSDNISKATKAKPLAPALAENLFTVTKTLHAHKEKHKVPSMHIDTSDSSSLFISMMKQSEDLPDIRETFTTSISPQNLVSEFSKAHLEKEPVGFGAQELRAILKRNEEYPWKPLVDTLVNKINGIITVADILSNIGSEQNKTSEETIKRSLDCIGLLLVYSSDADKAVIDPSNSGHFNNFLAANYQKKESNEITARILALMLSAEASNIANPPSNWSEYLQFNSSLPSAIKDKIKYFMFSGTLDSFLPLIIKAPHLKPLLQSVISKFISDGSVGTFNTENVLNDLTNTLGCFKKDDEEIFLNALVETKDFMDTLNGMPFNNTLWGALTIFANSGIQKLTTVTNTILSTHLPSYPPESWEVVIKKGEEPLELTKTAGYSKNINGTLRIALSNTVDWLLASTSELEVERWFTLPNYLSKGAKSTLFAELKDKICNGEKTQSINFIIKYGSKELFELGKFDDRGDATTRNVFMPLITHEHIELAHEHSSLFIKTLKKANPETKDHAKELLTDLHKKLTNENSPENNLNAKLLCTKELANLLGANLQETEEVDADQDTKQASALQE